MKMSAASPTSPHSCLEWGRDDRRRNFSLFSRPRCCPPRIGAFVDTDQESPQQSLEKILRYLRDKNLI